MYAYAQMQQNELWICHRPNSNPIMLCMSAMIMLRSNINTSGLSKQVFTTKDSLACKYGAFVDELHARRTEKEGRGGGGERWGSGPYGLIAQDLNAQDWSALGCGSLVPRPPVFQRVTLKNWEWPRDEAKVVVWWSKRCTVQPSKRTKLFKITILG